MKRMQFLMGILLLVIATSAQASVWKATRHWDEEADDEFSTWIAVLPLTIFSDPQSRYYGVATDCADAAYTLRILFSYERGLPVKFQGRGDLSNDTNEFDNLSDQPTSANSRLNPRLRAFLDRVRDNTSTEDLANDTYPVQINTQYVRAGTMFLHASSDSDPSVPITFRTGHVYYLKEVKENGMITYFSSTVPEAVRLLTPRYGIVFAPQDLNSGYRAWKWPDSNQLPPAYSQEQFEFANWYPHNFNDKHVEAFWERWQDAVQSRLRTRKITPYEYYVAADANLRAELVERITAVNQAWRYYQSHYQAGQAGQCENESEYEDYSTPTRDVRIQVELQNYRMFVMQYLKSVHQTTQAQTIYHNFQVEVLPGIKMDYLQLWNTFMTTTALAISEPEHDPQVRWGLTAQGNWPCPQRMKQYRGAPGSSNNP